MIRRDFPNREHQGSGRGGSIEIDRTIVEFSGTVSEANLIVQGLQLLLLEKQKIELMHHSAEGVEPLKELIASIESPNYTEHVTANTAS